MLLIAIGMIIVFVALGLAVLGYLIILVAYPLQATTRKTPTLIMILGSPANATGQPTQIMQMRLDAAVKLWQTGRYEQILVSGGAVKNQFAEAKVMQTTLIAAGVPANAILTEQEATNTYLNFKNSLPLIAGRSFILITSSWHVRKAVYYARRLGLQFQVKRAKDLPGHWWWLHFNQYPRYYFKMLYQLVQLPFWHEF